MPSVDPKHQQAVEKIARIFGLEKGSSALTSLSVLSARRKHEELAKVLDSLDHPRKVGEGGCGCKTIVFRMFLAYYLPGFLDLFAAVATDCETAAPFVFLLFDLVREPYLGSYLRQRTEHESLIQHQLSLLLAYVPGSLPKTTFKSVLQLDKWWRRVSSMCTLSLIFRTFLLHISVARGVANPIVPSEHTLALRDSLEGLIASLKLRLATPYDQRAILGARPSPRDAKEFSDLSRRANIAVEDTIDQLEALVPILRLKDGVDARTVFRLYKNDTQPKLYWEDVCVITPKEDEVQCKEGSLLTCSRCKSVMYCSKRHQRLHWNNHKLFCFSPCWGS